MAKITIEVPDGEYCGNPYNKTYCCKYMLKSIRPCKRICLIYNNHDENWINAKKCPACIQAIKEHMKKSLKDGHRGKQMKPSEKPSQLFFKIKCNYNCKDHDYHNVSERCFSCVIRWMDKHTILKVAKNG